MWFAGPIILLVFAIGSTVIWFLSTAPDPIFSPMWILGTVMFLSLWPCTVVNIVLCWPIITLDEAGISRSLFGVFFKKKISWDEVSDIRIFGMLTGGAFLFFSKKSLDNMSIYDARKQKGHIQVAFSVKLLKAIRYFTDMEIANLSEEEEQKLLEKTKNKRS